VKAVPALRGPGEPLKGAEPAGKKETALQQGVGQAKGKEGGRTQREVRPHSRA